MLLPNNLLKFINATHTGCNWKSVVEKQNRFFRLWLVFNQCSSVYIWFTPTTYTFWLHKCHDENSSREYTSITSIVMIGSGDGCVIIFVPECQCISLTCLLKSQEI